MSFSMNQVRSEKALLEKQEQLLKLREEQLVQVKRRIFYSTWIIFVFF